jgi:hypothetical protein
MSTNKGSRERGRKRTRQRRLMEVVDRRANQLDEIAGGLEATADFLRMTKRTITATAFDRWRSRVTAIATEMQSFATTMKTQAERES